MKWIVINVEEKRDPLTNVTNWKESLKTPLVSVASAGYGSWLSQYLKGNLWWEENQRTKNLRERNVRNLGVLLLASRRKCSWAGELKLHLGNHTLRHPNSSHLVRLQIQDPGFSPSFILRLSFLKWKSNSGCYSLLSQKGRTLQSKDRAPNYSHVENHFITSHGLLAGWLTQ